jgi:Family of unknown function (DUF6496)
MEKYSASDIPGSEKIGVINGCTIWEVPGQYVRDNIETAFVGGGHSYQDGFISDGEIWIEEMKSEEDETMIMAHEIVEYLMMCEAGYDYDSAHDLANEAEAVLRGHTQEEPEESEESGDLEQDKEIGAEKEAEEHDVSDSEAEQIAEEHEEEHPMYYKKMEEAGLGKAGSPKDIIMIMVGKRKPMGSGKGYGKSAPIPKPQKVSKVMGEFKSGALKSSSGDKVTNRKQAIAIALSEARRSKK